MTTTEYAIQFQRKPRGHWYTEDNHHTDLHLAQIDLKIEKAKSKVYEDYPQRWRIVKREVTEWKKVK